MQKAIPRRRAFSLSPAEAASSPAPPPGHPAVSVGLPALYHETYLHSIPRDPYTLFSFWETAGGKTTADGTAFLRIFETIPGSGERLVGDIAVERTAGSRYIRVPVSGRRYRLEFCIGTRGRPGRLLSSCHAMVPAAGGRNPRSSIGETRDRVPPAEVLAEISSSGLLTDSSPLGLPAGL